MSAFDYFAESVRRYAAHDLEGAFASAEAARAAAPEDLLYQSAARYLEGLRERPERGAIYSRGDAFSAFVGGGGNLPLYDTTRILLLDRLHALRPATLLDIGSGEGAVIIPVVSRMAHRPALTLCEPALPLLERAMAFARDSELEVDAYPYPIEDVIAGTDRLWDAAVATWSLHTLPWPTRAALLPLLAQRVGRLFIAEFDDPSGSWPDPLAEERIRHVHDRYQVGVEEYPGQEGRRVRQGFLMPVLYGYFAHEGKRSTFEQPIERWEVELREAGFELIERTLIFPYWWADAYLLTARPSGV